MKISIFLVAAIFVMSCASSHPPRVDSRKIASKEERETSELAKPQDIGAWAKANGFEANWLRLPKEGAVKRAPWADTNWPNYLGNTNWRWNDPKGPQAYQSYENPSEAEVRAMKREDLARLSPAEKYSIFIGDFDYMLPNALGAEFDGSEPWWAGLCDKWAPTALGYAEPAAVDVRGPSGITVPFGSSDVKALLLEWVGSGEAVAITGSEGLESEDFWAFAKVTRALTPFFGEDCETNGIPACDDISPSTFHSLLANHVGLKNEGFVLDVWHRNDFESRNYFQPVHSYKTLGMQSTPIPGGKRIRVKTLLITATDIGDISADRSKIVAMPQWKPRKAKGNLTNTVTYEYEIEIDQRNIIRPGGRWLTKEQPDIIQFRNAPGPFRGFYKHLADIYKPVM